MDKRKKGFVIIVAVVSTILFMGLIIIGNIYNRRVTLRTVDYVSNSASERKNTEDAYWCFLNYPTDKNVPNNYKIDNDHLYIYLSDQVLVYEFYIENQVLLIRKDFYE